MEQFLSSENITLVFLIVGGMITIISTGLAVQWRYYRQKTENLQNLHKAELKNLTAEHNKECAKIHQKSTEESQALKKTLEKEMDLKKAELSRKTEIPLVQEVKMVYIKYLHIRPPKEAPVYQKYINRLKETIDVHSEYHYYRFNKYSTHNNAMTITDRSSGVVDQNILHPWKKLTFTDKPSEKIKGVISQDIEGNDTYFSATTYYNGFKEENEDIAMKMEMETLCARMVADFSSIVGLAKLFTEEPKAFKIDKDGTKTQLLGLEKLAEGIYHLVAYNLKKGESLELDFHVNWDYLKDD